MSKRGKKYQKSRDSKPQEALSPEMAIEAVKELSYSSFPGSIELHLVMKLPKDKDPKSIKGALTLPNQIQKPDIKIAVFTTADKQDEAKKAGADLYDLEKLTKAINSGKIEFDVAIATPDVMGEIASLGKELGPRGLMPNPKTGTVTDELKETIDEYRDGKTPFSADASGNMHFKVGKVDMDETKVLENMNQAIRAAGESVGKKPESVIKKAYLAPTMGPSVELLLDFDTM